MAYPSGIQDAQAPVAFGPTFLGRERAIRRAAQRAIRLESKSVASKAAHLRWLCEFRWFIRYRHRFVGNGRRI